MASYVRCGSLCSPHRWAVSSLVICVLSFDPFPPDSMVLYVIYQLTTTDGLAYMPLCLHRSIMHMWRHENQKDIVEFLTLQVLHHMYTCLILHKPSINHSTSTRHKGHHTNHYKGRTVSTLTLLGVHAQVAQVVCAGIGWQLWNWHTLSYNTKRFSTLLSSSGASTRTHPHKRFPLSSHGP